MSDSQKTSNLLGTGLLAAALFLLFLGERVLGQDGAKLVAEILGGAALLAALALRTQAFVRSRGDVRGVEARILAAYLAVVVALGLYGLSTDPVVTALGLADEAQTRYVSVLSVLWPALLSVALAALLFMELVYARMPIAASVELRRVRTAAYAGLTLAFSLVFLLSMNYVVTARDVRKDLSYFKTTQPSAATLRLVEKLEAPVRVVLFWRKNDDVLQQIEPYFAALAKQSKQLTYEVLDSAFVPELSRKHRINGNGSVLLLQGTDDKQKGQSIAIGNELTEARAHLRKLDGMFQQSFTKLAKPERAVSLTVGHGEHNATHEGKDKPGDSVRVMDEVWRRLNIKTSKLSASDGLAANISAETGAVVVVGPQQKFLSEEVDTLLGYVRKGGRLLLMLDPGVDDGLDPLLAQLGVQRQPGTVASEKNHLRRAHDDTDKLLTFSNKYSSHPTVTTASRFQSEVASIFVAGAGLDRTPAQSLTPKPTVSFPLRTGPGFFRDLNGNLKRDANEAEESVNVIAAVTVTEKQGAPEGRVVVIGDGDFMTDKVSTNNGNVMVFVDALGWLIGNEELNAEVSSEEDVPIEHSRDRDKLWFYATTFAVPLPLLGLSAWVARRRRRPTEGES
ncbi:MAG: DUF4350 domain-containing protein [Polyangiales bacterium]